MGKNIFYANYANLREFFWERSKDKIGRMNMKMKSKAKWILAVIVVVVAAWFVFPVVAYPSRPLPDAWQQELMHATNFEALALNHLSIESLQANGVSVGTNQLMDFVILGGVQIINASLQQKLVEAICSDIKHAHHMSDECFKPRHAIRCQDGTNFIVMAICYQCGNVVVRRNGGDEYYLIRDGQSPASRQIFEQIFQDAGVKEDGN